MRTTISKVWIINIPVAPSRTSRPREFPKDRMRSEGADRET